jgi:hypothetical protein
MNRFLNFLVRLSEDAYASRKDSLESMYCLNETAEEVTRATASKSEPARYTLHHCAICNANHY